MGQSFSSPCFLREALESKVQTLRRWRRQRCTECDYDLRAHPGGGNCPECAAPVPVKFQQLCPVAPPKKPMSLFVTVPLLVLPLVPVIWILMNSQLDDLVGQLATLAYLVAAGYLASGHVSFRRWKSLQCTRCRCDLRAHLASVKEGPRSVHSAARQFL